MKKVVLTLAISIGLFSCDSVKNVNTSTVSQAATLLSSLSSNATVQQISSLFSLLDANKDEAISSTEAIGSVSENFNTLDTDNNSSLNLSELTGLLGLLK
ncbi:hypothetical protein [Lacinutrix himadriensis]|uniref:hypothetical protein n=1 Tax=Lacinutrix himadriensis TaxID=641549 RepID=UPI0006E44192|nr:hypothetical protein [Lacinutrix himadriensis]